MSSSTERGAGQTRAPAGAPDHRRKRPYAEESSIDSFIAGFELAWKLSVELNHYENERSVSCQTAMGSGARFASKEEEK